EHSREILMPVAVSVGQPAAVDDHRVVEQRAVAVLRRLELVEQICELLDVELIDLGDLLDLLFIARMVREAVMAFRDADLGIVPRALLEGQQSGNDPGLIRSEEHTSELQSLRHLVCRLLLEKKKKKKKYYYAYI